MKTIFILSVILLLGCDNLEKSIQQHEIESKQNRIDERLKRFNTVVYDSCEYVVAEYNVTNGYNAGSITHKGNCRFCKVRGKN